MYGRWDEIEACHDIQMEDPAEKREIRPRCHSPKGWMDEAGTQQWLHQVWNARPGAMMDKRSMLDWDVSGTWHRIMQKQCT